jgi:hypothetical protein
MVLAIGGAFAMSGAVWRMVAGAGCSATAGGDV